MQTDAKDQYTDIVGINSLDIGKTKILFSNETEKKNPNSLRFVIGHIVTLYFHGSRKDAVNFFRRENGRYKSNRANFAAKTMNTKALSDIIDDNKYAAYWHLEAISQGLKFPVGALLSLSRVYSLIRDGKSEAVDAFILGLRRFADRLENLARQKAISKHELDQMIACFEKTYEAEKPTLFDHATP